MPWRDEILDHALPIKDGQIHLSDRPGLGVSLIDEVLAEHPGVNKQKHGIDFTEAATPLARPHARLV